MLRPFNWATTDIVTPLSVGGGPEVMTVEGYGAAGAVFLNLGNNKTGWTFDCTINFATDTAANAFWMTGIPTYAGTGTVELAHIDYEAATTTWTINNAKIELNIDPPIGPCCHCKLTITGNPA